MAHDLFPMCEICEIGSPSRSFPWALQYTTVSVSWVTLGSMGDGEHLPSGELSARLPSCKHGFKHSEINYDFI